jgi:hypothetical protein
VAQALGSGKPIASPNCCGGLRHTLARDQHSAAGSASMERGYTQATWMTFRQALEYGAHIRKGEHGVQVVYCDRINRADSNEEGHRQS